MKMRSYLDDFNVVALDFETDLPKIQKAIATFSRASKVILNVDKTMIIPSGRKSADYLHASLAVAFNQLHRMRIVDSARLLGVWVGPGATRNQT